MSRFLSSLVSRLVPQSASCTMESGLKTPAYVCGLSARSFSLSAAHEKRRKGGCTKWKRGGLIATSIYTGFKGQAPIPKPLHDFQTGDRNLGYDPVSPHTPQSPFREVDMSVLDPMVRRILSAETSDNWDLIKYHEETIMERVRRYPGDTSSIEVRIAQKTFKWKELYACFKHNKHSRKKLLPVLTYMEKDRYELLMKLRLSDYDRFVWLCDVLQIDFQLKPEVRVELTDKEKILVQAQQEADAVKEDKLLEYKKFLEKERENFEKLKKETVEKLQSDLAQFGFSGEPAEKLADQQR